MIMKFLILFLLLSILMIRCIKLLQISLNVANGSENSNNSNNYPKHIEQAIGTVLFQNCAPRKQNSINSIENPYKKKWTIRTKPADQAEAENPHNDSNHFKSLYISQYKLIHWILKLRICCLNGKDIIQILKESLFPRISIGH